MKIRETDLKRAVLNYLQLQYPTGLFWVGNAGMRFAEHKGKRRAIKLGPTGSPDVAGILPPHGRYIGVETKIKPNTQTAAQLAWQNAVEQAGGIYILAYCIEDVMKRTCLW
jgi:hypothetical protein